MVFINVSNLKKKILVLGHFLFWEHEVWNVSNEIVDKAETTCKMIFLMKCIKSFWAIEYALLFAWLWCQTLNYIPRANMPGDRGCVTAFTVALFLCGVAAPSTSNVKIHSIKIILRCVNWMLNLFDRLLKGHEVC